MAYSAAVEQWRPLVEQYFAPGDVDKALYVISLESGGNPNAVGDGGASIGLFQLNDNGLGAGMGGTRYDPAANIAAAAAAVYGGQGWKPWGENNSYNGSVFGALGNNPYPGNTGAINGMAAVGSSAMAEPIYIGVSLGPSGGGMYYDPNSGQTWTQDTGWYNAGPQSPYPTGGAGGVGGAAPGGTAPGGTAPGGSTSGITYTTRVDTDGSLSGVPGATVRVGSNGSVSIISRPSTGGTSGITYTTRVDTDGSLSGVPGATVRVGSNGSVSIISRPAATTSSGGNPQWPGDKNNDGIDDSTGLANGVVKVSTSLSPTGYIYGTTPVYPNGAPYTGGPTNTGPQYVTKVSDGKDGFPPGTIYQLNTDTGQRTNIRYPSTSSSSSGGSSSGGGGGGGSSSSSVHSGGYNNVTTDIRSGGYNNTNTNINQSTSFNTSDIGPNTIANNAADRAQRASEFAAQNALNKTEQQRQAAKDYANLLMTVDPNAYQAFLAANGGGRLDNALLSGGNALSADAINPAAMALAASRGQEYSPTTGATGGTAGGGLQPTDTGGRGPTFPGATGGGGNLPAGASGTPAAAPADTSFDYWKNNVYHDTRGQSGPGEAPLPPVSDAELQAQYQAWKAALPPAATPAVPTPWDQYGPPPEGYSSWADWLQVSGNGPAWLASATGARAGGQSTDINAMADQLAPWIRQYQQQMQWQADPAAAARAQQTINQMAAGWRPQVLSPEVRYARYMANVPGSAQWNNNLKPGDVGYQSMQTPGAYIGGGQYAPAATTTVNTGGDTAQNPGFNTISPQPTNPAPASTVQIVGGLPTNTTPLGPSTNPTEPLTATSGTGFHAGDPNYRYDPATGTYVHLAYGGMTRAPMAVVGDPQADGRPNPEIIHNPTGAPISVMPMRNMGGLPRPNAMAMQHANPNARFMRMGGLPRYAYGTYDQLDAPAADGTITARDLLYSTPPTYSYAGDTKNTYVAPATTTQTAEPLPATASAPTTTVNASAPTATADTTNNPATIGVYSTAPGTAGESVTTPATTAPPAATTTPTSPLEQPGNPLFNEVLYTRLAATNPWMSDPTAYMNVDYLTRDPVARRQYEQWLTMAKGIPQESIDFAQARNRLGGASLASMGQGR